MSHSRWVFTSGTKGHTQDGTQLVQLMKSVGHGRRKVFAIDVGCGDGVITYDLFRLKKATQVFAVDILKEAVEATSLNLRDEISEGRVEVCKSRAQKIFSDKKFFERFDRFVINPPFFPEGSGQKNKKEADQIARHEGSLKLKDWARGARKLLKTSGELYFVFPTERLAEACAMLSQEGVEPKEVWWIKEDLRRRRFFMRAVRGASPGLKVHF